MMETVSCLLSVLLFHVIGSGNAIIFNLSTEPSVIDTRPKVTFPNEPSAIPSIPIVPITETAELTIPSNLPQEHLHMGTPAGIYFRISQKGVDYITSLAAKALPQLLEKTEMPTVVQPQIKISHLTIDKFSDPTIRANFIANAGVRAHVFLPQVMLNALYDTSTFFSTYKGKFKADVQNLSVTMEVHIKRNEEEKMNIIKTPVCNVTSSLVRIVFAGSMSTYLNLLRSVIEQSVIDVLGNELCQTAVKVAHFFERQKQQILMTTPPQPSTSPITPTPTHLLHFGAPRQPLYTTSVPTVENENAIYETSDEENGDDEDLAAKFAADLCAEDRIDEPISNVKDSYNLRSKRALYFQTTPETQRLNPLLRDGFWAPDLTLLYAPKFSNEDVVFGLDAGIVFYGRKAKNVSRPSMLNISALGDQMFGVIVSEYVPNTYFAHVYDEGLGILRETFRTYNLPRFIKPVAKLLCPRCELQFIANLTRRPHLSINQQGVKIDIQIDVMITFVGKTKRHNVVNANSELDVTVRPYLRHSRLYGDVALTSVDIKMKEMGVGGIFANSVRKALNTVVPKRLWPKIKKRLRFAFNQRGIKIPVMCGIELERPAMSYIDHALVIDTDFSYDLPRFIRKFKAYINSEVALAKRKEEVENEEDY